MVDRLAIAKRLQADGRWGEAESVKNQMIKEARQQGMDKEEAQAWAYSEVDRMYPPLQSEPVEFPSASDSHAASPSGRVQGLGDIPADWPPLSANASLQAEIGWVQASRLDVVEEAPCGATVVHLDRADNSAPSKAAIGWLETSIRAYSKYCDIAAKATQHQEHEAESLRREKMAIDEVRGLLAEMRPENARD